MNEQPIYSPTPPKNDKTMTYILVGALVLCCLCFGLLGTVLAFGEMIGQALGF